MSARGRRRRGGKGPPPPPPRSGGEGRGEGATALPRARLVAAARAVRRNAYAPYSRFRVGAAVLAGGRIFAGANVENASYGLTVCGERAAVSAAFAAGEKRLDAVAVASGTAEPTPPCGACLQTLAELGGPSLPVLLAGPRGEAAETTLRELLPRAFGRRFLAR